MPMAIATAQQAMAAKASARTAGSDSGRINRRAGRTGAGTDAHGRDTVAQPIFLPAARDRGWKVTGRSTMVSRLEQAGGDLGLDVEAIGGEAEDCAPPTSASPCSRSPCR